MLGSKEAEKQVGNQVEGERRLFLRNCDAFSPLHLALELRRTKNHTPAAMSPPGTQHQSASLPLDGGGVTASRRILRGLSFDIRCLQTSLHHVFSRFSIPWPRSEFWKKSSPLCRFDQSSLKSCPLTRPSRAPLTSFSLPGPETLLLEHLSA